MSRQIIALFLFFAASMGINCRSGNERNVNDENLYNITKIVDGDTFWAENGKGNKIKVRLIGIDAPESRKTFKKEVSYFGKEAKLYLKSLLTGQKVKLEFDVSKSDQYNRTLAYVYLQNGVFVNAELVKNGYAMVMTVPPNVKYADLFLKLQQEARENFRGLWAIE